MSPIQQMLLGVGAVAKKTYVDDIFSSYLWTGNSSSRSINNGVDLSTEGGMAWIKRRNSGGNHQILDTARGATKALYSNDSSAEETFTNGLTAFNSNGFSLGNHGNYNTSSNPYVSWTFRKAPGFFDVVTYTGNGSARTIAHSLGSVPGMILIKNLSSSENWIVYHHTLKATHHVRLNQINASASSMTMFNDTEPTASVFSVGTNSGVNTNGDNYVAYVFAGGESTAATARSVDFDGTGDYLTVASSDDFHLTGDFTIEGWFYLKQSSSVEALWSIGTYDSAGGVLCYIYNNLFYIYNHSTNYLGISKIPVLNQWTHIAVVRSGTTVSVYFDGIFIDSYTFSNDFGSSSNKTFYVGGNSDGDSFEGKISNFRIVKGTAVYTSSFRPPTAPLTNITNTKLLCCNNSSTTGSTVTPGTITANGDPTASSDSPFDDPAGFVFGDAGDQNVIKCGSYHGNNTSNGPEIYLGWEPQWVLVKTLASGTLNKPGNWRLLDSMRGIVTGGADPELEPNSNSSEDTGNNRIAATPTGFKIDTASSSHNDNNEYIYVAIRRSDGYVGKPPELGTGVFAMDTGNSSSTIPCFDSNFAVDFALITKPATTLSNYVAARLFSGKELITDGTGAEGTAGNNTFDSNAGWRKGGADSTFQSWMWKRHAGFDCIAFQGSSSDPGPSYAHGLGKIPELKIIKRRNASSTGWITTGTVVSQAIAGNNNSKDYYLYLNTDAAATNFSNYWSGNDTSTHFTVRHGNGEAGGSADPYLCLLFASVDGISKVGSYSGSNSSQTITVGFQPRFLIIKCSTNAENWVVVDTTRGWASGNDKILVLNSSGAQSTWSDIGAPTSTGFTLTGGDGVWNANGESYIYYAHA